MKKFLVLSIFLLLCAKTCAAELFQPQWSEFCPPKFLNVQMIKSNILNKEEAAENNYWCERRLEFEQTMQNCDKTSESFAKIRTVQSNKTGVYYNQKRLEQMKRRSEESQIQTSAPCTAPFMPFYGGMF